MALTDDRSIARQAEELAGLVAGREPPGTVARLHAIARCAAAGRLPAHTELSLFERMRARYGRELAELERPEPW
jgi:hypothetical protein